MASSKKFFKVLEPRHAAVVVGILEVLGASIVLLCVVGALGNLTYLNEHVLTQENLKQAGVSPSSGEKVKNLISALEVVLIAVLLVLLIGFSFQIMLLVGALKERRRLLLPWLIVRFLSLVSGALSLLSFVIKFIAVLPILTVCVAAACTLNFVFQVHCWLAVKEAYSHFGEVNPQHVFKSTRLENMA